MSSGIFTRKAGELIFHNKIQQSSIYFTSFNNIKRSNWSAKEIIIIGIGEVTQFGSILSHRDKQAIQHTSKQKGKREKGERKREAELINQGAARNIKVNYAAKGNTLSKVNAQQMIICAVLRDNTLYGYVRDNLSEEDFTDPDMKAAYIEIKKIIENGNPATYSALSYRIPETRADSIGRTLRRTAELVITLRDVKQYTDNLINAKMSQTERSEKSLDEIARHLDSIKARKQ